MAKAEQTALKDYEKTRAELLKATGFLEKADNLFRKRQLQDRRRWLYTNWGTIVSEVLDNDYGKDMDEGGMYDEEWEVETDDRIEELYDLYNTLLDEDFNLLDNLKARISSAKTFPVMLMAMTDFCYATLSQHREIDSISA